eukprot:scaffold1092_cov108-Skeletonema_menzelii.AAC.1
MLVGLEWWGIPTKSARPARYNQGLPEAGRMVSHSLIVDAVLRWVYYPVRHYSREATVAPPHAISPKCFWNAR